VGPPIPVFSVCEVVDVVVNAAVAVKLFSITVQSNTILPTNIHSYLVVCETLLIIEEKEEGREIRKGKEREIREKGRGRRER
jgi:hypothetical protein